jgi:hypothetical protein
LPEKRGPEIINLVHTGKRKMFKILIFRSQILRPTAAIQEEMIIGGLADILLRAGEGKEAVVCMLGPEDCFETNSNYGIDGFTERVLDVDVHSVCVGGEGRE